MRRHGWRYCGVVALALALVVIGGAPRHARGASAATGSYKALLQTLRALPRGERAQVCRTFAAERDLALAERTRAARHCLSLATSPRERLDDTLLLAHLQVAGEARGPRLATLQRALTLAQRAHDGRVTALRQAVRGEQALGKLIPLVKRLERRPTRAHAASLVTPLRAVDTAIGAWRSLGDEVALQRALLWLWRGRSVLPKPPSTEALATGFDAALMTCATDRDCAGQRALLQERRVTLLLQLDRWHEAVVARLSADREALAAPAQPAAPFPTYGRSAQSAALCRRAHDHGVRCDAAEELELGQVSSYDFSQEPPLANLDQAHADQVLAEYDWLIRRCIRASADRGELPVQKLELRWPVASDGRVGRHEIVPAQPRGGSFDSCLQKAFARLRYFRHGGDEVLVVVTFFVAS